MVIGGSLQDVTKLQNENKMKAALGKNVKISLSKAFQISNEQTKSLAVKGVPTDIMDNEFKEFLDLNKILYAKAEHLKSKKDGRVLPLFRIEINDPSKAEALISQNLVFQIPSIVHKVEEFRSPVPVRQCFNCQSFGHFGKKIVGQNKNVSSVVKTILTKDARIKNQENLCVPNKGSHVESYKGRPKYQ